MNGQKKRRQHLQNEKLIAERDNAQKWVTHFEENGQTDTCWHDILERVNKALGEKPKAEPKPKAEKSEVKEKDYGSQDIN